MDEDEHPRAGSTYETLSELKPLFGGVVTAGNASGINDGAAAVLIGSARAGERAGAKPLARILARRRGRGGAARHGNRPGLCHSEGAGTRRTHAQRHGRDRD
ncbi:thiolase family protein [Paludibacterium denitrificans]|uniref:thiolase family protein n=1 Tax=Paludibacterium denitrificans TaxID=2675226 RepID=UPI0028A9C5BB|nr:hypothetical protein [Paludibacterium denitrificans]